MPLDRDALETELNSMRRQKDSARDAYHQAFGAERLLLSLMERMDEPSGKEEVQEAEDDVS